MNLRSRMRALFGGVAERLIAPVLKTGRPKGLVSSNLTPSAIFEHSTCNFPQLSWLDRVICSCELIRRDEEETVPTSYERDAAEPGGDVGAI